jgi:hypothetical protein
LAGNVHNSAHVAIVANESITFTGTDISLSGCGSGFSSVTINGNPATCTNTNVNEAVYTVNDVSFASGTDTPLQLNYATTAYYSGPLTVSVLIN